MAVEAHSSGLDLGRFTAALSGPEVGVEGVAYGPGGFVAFGWARSGQASRVGTGPNGVTPALWRSDDGRSWERLPTPDSFVAKGPGPSGAWPTTIVGRMMAISWRRPLRITSRGRHLEQPGRGDLDADGAEEASTSAATWTPGDAGRRRDLAVAGARGRPRAAAPSRSERPAPTRACRPRGLGDGVGRRRRAARLCSEDGQS
jgi:hypothetical protein